MEIFLEKRLMLIFYLNYFDYFNYHAARLVEFVLVQVPVTRNMTTNIHLGNIIIIMYQMIENVLLILLKPFLL